MRKIDGVGLGVGVGWVGVRSCDHTPPQCVRKNGILEFRVSKWKDGIPGFRVESWNSKRGRGGPSVEQTKPNQQNKLTE
jgi:hypothetical protein